MQFISISQVVISILLAISILLQNRGSSLGGAFGGGGASYHTRRGFEKFLSWASIALATLFLVSALLNVYLAGH